VPIEEVRERRGGYEDRIDRQLDPLAPADRATLPGLGHDQAVAHVVLV
jgi:hypothetical protein